MRKFSTVLAGVVLIAVILACNLPSSQPDPASIMTAAALTVQAQLSPTVPVPATATNTPVPFPTLPLATLPPPATPTSSCDNAHFVTDVTYPDNTVVTAGDNFTKTWRFQNYGACSWTPSYALVFMSGDSMNGPTVQALTGSVNPGQTVEISVDLTAPSSSGTHTGNWGLRNAAGVIFAHFYVQIVVGSTSGAFAVTHVTYDLSTFNDGGNTGCPMVTAHISVNKAGDVQYHWVRSDGPETGQTLHFSSSGTQDVQEKWYLGSAATGTQWLGIYIDAPNHQDFGHTNINKCITP